MTGTRLDFALSMGYFRMQQQVFTCRWVPFNDDIYPAYWLRIDLAAVRYGPKQSRLFRINERFSTTVKPLGITAELENLYARYRNGIDFDAPESVTTCMMGGAKQTAFDTYVLEIRDAGTLIAAGIFDNGGASIAGIMNFYDPDYRKQSLGKYLMLMKMEYARQQRKTWYYPGYIVGNYPKFDYKLFACQPATEVYDDHRGMWLPFSWEILGSLE